MPVCSLLLTIAFFFFRFLLLLPSSSFLFSSRMRRLNLTRSTRSIYLSLACLSLVLHLLLAFFCLSILQTTCVLPPSSSSGRGAGPGQRGSRPGPQTNVQGRPPAEEDPFGGRGKQLIGGGKAAEEVRGHSKLEALFRHPLYNLPRPQLQEDDWLLQLTTSGQVQEEGLGRNDWDDSEG